MWQKWYAKFRCRLHVSALTLSMTLEQDIDIEVRFKAPEEHVEVTLAAFEQELDRSMNVYNVRRIEYCRES